MKTSAVILALVTLVIATPLPKTPEVARRQFFGDDDFSIGFADGAQDRADDEAFGPNADFFQDRADDAADQADFFNGFY